MAYPLDLVTQPDPRVYYGDRVTITSNGIFVNGAFLSTVPVEEPTHLELTSNKSKNTKLLLLETND